MQNTTIFINLLSSDTYKGAKYYIVNLDIHPKLMSEFKLADTTIHFYEKRILKSSNYMDLVGENMNVICPISIAAETQGSSRPPDTELS